MVSAASVVSMVKNIAPSKEETHIYLPQTAESTSQSMQSPTCAPIAFPAVPDSTGSYTITTAYTKTTVTELSPIYISAIPLSEELQIIMQDACKEYGVPYSLALAVCEAESTFDPDADNGVCWGLMQINPVNYKSLRNIGIEPTTYEGNIEAGVYMLGQLLDKYDDDTHKALMAYNCGDAGAARLWDQGYVTSSYSENVVEKSQNWQDIIAEYTTGGKKS